MAAVQGLDRPVCAAATRDDIVALLAANERQVLVYWPEYGGDVGWVAEALERYPDLRVVYLSPTPWVSLSYSRARCIIAPHAINLLDVGLLRRMVAELLGVGADRKGNRARQGGHGLGLIENS
jgi:hypothetical protein